MASSSEKPKKSILKSSGSVDHNKKEIEWDEMNIMATYHPANKDYGHMKVEEPPTPFNRAAISDSEDDTNSERRGSIDSNSALDPEQLALRLASDIGSSVDRKYYTDEEDDEADYENMTEEERSRKKAFLMKRKMHYNEFAAVQLAKKLMSQEEDQDDAQSGSSSQSKVTPPLDGKASAKGKKSADKKQSKHSDHS